MTTLTRTPHTALPSPTDPAPSRPRPNVDYVTFHAGDAYELFRASLEAIGAWEECSGAQENVDAHRRLLTLVKSLTILTEAHLSYLSDLVEARHE